MTPLHKTIHDIIKKNGGTEMMAQLIISENPEYFHANFEASRAEIWLQKRGVYNGRVPKDIIHPVTKKRYSKEDVEMIKKLYNEPEKLNIILKRDTRRKIYSLHKSGEIERGQLTVVRWTDQEDSYILHNGTDMVVEKMIPELHKLNPDILRTWGAVASRKSKLGIKLHLKYKLPRVFV